MMKRWIGVGGLAVAAATLWAAGNGDKQPVPQPHYGDVAQKVARVLPAAHLLQLPLSDELSQKAWTNLITSFDFDRSYFLQSDIEAFTNMQTRIDDAVKAGDVSFPFEVYRVFRERIEERYAFVTNLLDQGFSFTEDESYTWKRKDAPWPATPQERDELWRKRIKNEILVQMIGRELDQAAATNKAASATGATNGLPRPEVASHPAAVTNAPPVLSPQENVAKRYKQFMIVIQDMDEEAILQRYLGAVAMAYDPHSDYMSPMRKEDFDIDMNLSLCGIGAQLRSEDGTALIMEVIPGGPADRDKRAVRLTKGDKIIGVGQGDGEIEDIVHLPLNRTVRKIRGAKGTKVVLSVIPSSDPSGTTTKIVDLIRDEVKLEEQAATGRVARVTLEDGSARKIGVVKLPTFYGTMDKRPNQPGYRSATLDVARQLAAFNGENVAGLVLDLRNNGGGSLREAVSLTGLFVRSGPVVQVREARQIVVLPVPNMDPAMAFRKPMLVLVNRASASASEIVAGALQDYGRAVLVGDTQSHGKGTVQTVMPLGSEKFGSIKVTTASFYRITGSSTQRRGVAADIVIPSTLDGLDSIGEDKLPGSLPWTQIESALYIPVADVAKFVPRLKEQSAKRLAENARYGRYSALVRHVQEVNEKRDVTLELSARRRLMKAENEMRKLEDEEQDAAQTEGQEDDVVLDEALHILSDLVTLSGGADIPMETEGDLRTRMMRIFGRDL
jgi:carboxyl-terminal processing protease